MIVPTREQIVKKNNKLMNDNFLNSIKSSNNQDEEEAEKRYDAYMERSWREDGLDRGAFKEYLNNLKNMGNCD